jgi:N-acetylneuraminic acid mutarotase
MRTKSTSPSGFLSLRAITILFGATAACSVLTVPLLAFLRPQEQVNGSQRTLSFEERVSYQKAIEEVYWRHRIWPKERKDPKPSLDSVMSNAQLEKKVTDYLRNSQALEDYWQRPITAEQLQAEMDRMAAHTRQPEVLRELFEALGNDPFVIAECLARPALAERLLTNWYAYDQRIHGELKQRAEGDLQTHPAVEQMKQALPAAASRNDAGAVSSKYSEIEFVKSDRSDSETHRGPERGVRLTSHEWDEIVEKLAETFSNSRSNQLNAQPCSHGAVSPCSQAQTAQNASAQRGGYSNSPQTKNAGLQAYEIIPVGKLSSLHEDNDRYYSTAVVSKGGDRLKLATVSWLKEPLESWTTKTQSQIFVAMPAPGGNYTLPKISGSGCIDDTWTSTSGPPHGRSGHVAVWTGSEMIVWGGTRANAAFFNTGGRYNPSTDSWANTSASNAPSARAYHTAIWTGSEMIVFGGYNGNELNTGGRYNPSTNGWTATSSVSAPSARGSHTAVWTGSEMIVWGGYDGSSEVNTGGKYDPSTDSWEATGAVNSPAGRYSHTAVWTGSEMIVWGGVNSGAGVNTGGKYDPGTNSWTATSMSNAPTGRYGHAAVWTGTEMIVWGGYDVDNNQYLNTGGKYNPITDSWSATSSTNAPESRSDHTALWTGSEMIVWGGSSFDTGYHYLDTGAKYDPASNSWIATSTINSPTARDSHTAIWTGNEMIIWGGTGNGYLNTGGRYNPISDDWLPTGNTPSSRIFHTAIWTGSEMIIWGGISQSSDSYPRQGAKYDPSTDGWLAISNTDAPTGRELPTAVWTGTEMIVWGGYSYDGIDHYWNTGGKYNPGADSWSASSVTNAPVGREFHTAVWTGSEMIVWGGSADFPNYYNTGGRYNPGTDSWAVTTTTNAPSARVSHSAVWTGSEMIVWGGTSDASGGRYNPGTNGWTATSTSNAPSGRAGQRAVWSGSEMIVWGGYFFDGNYQYLNTGGRYNPNSNTWAATTIANAPAGRSLHTAVWAGNEMIVWGGQAGDVGYYFNTGGRYDAGADNWTATSAVNVPDARDRHTAVWTGSEMIVWGGALYSLGYTSSGARYCVQSGPTPTPTPCMGRCGPTPRPRPTPRVRPTPR